MNLLEEVILNPDTPIVPNDALIGRKVSWKTNDLIHVSPAMYELLNDAELDKEELYFIAENIEVVPPPSIYLMIQLNATINKTLQERFKKIYKGINHVTP